MGVGKTTTSKKLLKLLPNCVFLDGDWCWYADPWTVTDETKQMMYNNTSYLLNNFLNCSVYENVIFCWGMYFESVITNIHSLIKYDDYNLYIFSLVCSGEACENALAKIPYYYKAKTVKIDISDITPDTAADIIYNYIRMYGIL